MRLEALPDAGLHEQRLQHIVDPLRRAEETLHARPSTPARDQGEIARPGLAPALAVDHDRHARPEVRLANQQLAAPGELDNKRFY